MSAKLLFSAQFWLLFILHIFEVHEVNLATGGSRRLSQVIVTALAFVWLRRSGDIWFSSISGSTSYTIDRDLYHLHERSRLFCHSFP